MELADSSAVVTGGGSGLGEAVARDLALRGAFVVVLDRELARAKAVASAVKGVAVEADVADEQAVRRALDAATEAHPLRALVNCAGVGRSQRTLDRKGVPQDLAKFEFVVRVNLTGTFNCVRLAAAAMAKNDPQPTGERGAILNTASVAAFDGQIGQVSYSASKGAIVGMTLPLARDLAPVGIRVNTIAPGLFDTPIYGSGPDAEAFKSRLTASAVFPERLGTPEEFASLAAELLTNPYMNGEVVRLDGAVRLPPR